MRQPAESVASEAQALASDFSQFQGYATIAPAHGGPDAAPTAEALDAKGQGPRDLTGRQRWVLLAALNAGVFLQGLDTTIVAATATKIGNEFHLLNRAAWINTAYLLTMATSVPIFGKVSDIVGRRAAGNVSWLIFILGAVLAGTPRSMSALIAARLVQGIGGGGLGIIGPAVLTDVCSLRERAMYASLTGLTWALGTGLGGPFGGYISDMPGLGWRWAFLIQIPFMLITRWALMRYLTYRVPGQSDSFSEVRRRVDFAGSLALILALGGIVLGLGFRTNENFAWAHPLVAGTFAASLLVGAAFFWVELRWAEEPVLSVAVLKDRTQLACCSAGFFTAAGTIGNTLYFPMILQILRGETPAESGLRLLPAPFVGAIATVLVGVLIRSTGRYKVLSIAMATTMLLSCVLLARLDARSPEWETWLDLPPSNFGLSGVYTSTIVAALAGVPGEKIGTTLGMLMLLRSLGQVLGLALASAVQQTVLERSLSDVIDDPELIESIRKSAEVIGRLPEGLRSAAVSAFGQSLHWVFGVAGGVTVLAVLSTCFIVEKGLQDGKKEGPDSCA